jgi:hypothetical protein
MNNKLQSSLSILAITCAVAVPLLLPTAHELPLQAALTAPASYDYRYWYDGSEYAIYSPEIAGASTYYSTPKYTRTPDSTYYNYSSTYEVIDHLQITQTFNRSNTSWTLDGSLYVPTDTKIGSDNTVGTLIKKMDLSITNNTANDFLFYLDYSSTTATPGFVLVVNSYVLGATYIINRTSLTNTLVIPSSYTVQIYTQSISTALYFDAWYLKNLGVSASWQDGYDLADEGPVLISAVESLIGMFVNFTFILFSLEMFGVSILSIVGVLFGIIAIVWILKTIRGG